MQEVPEQDPRYVVQVWHDTNRDVQDLGESYLHCALCLAEWRESFSGMLSPKQYARQQVALTRDGRIQVWCSRHECNITMMTLRATAREEATECG